MTEGGLSEGRLDRMHDTLARYCERGEVPGIVMLLKRRGETYVDAIGETSITGGKPVTGDAIFRISSMTKPVTAVATLMLLEECKLRLDAPVDGWLPELANRRVLKSLRGPIDDTVPAERPTTVRDLLAFRMGFGLLFGGPGEYPILDAVRERELLGMGPPEPASPLSPDEWIRRLGELPLMHQPGERWMYNMGSYVLGVLIARASGKPLDVFFRERIFEPLGMKDTGFHVPEEKRSRFTACYARRPGSNELSLVDDPSSGAWSHPPVFPDAGAGLVSTAGDFLAFAQMLLDFGRCGTGRLLSRPSVEAMTTDQLTPGQKKASPFFPGCWDDGGYGFGVSVVTHRGGPTATPGQYGWDGGYGSSWRSDPREQMVGIILTTRLFSSPQLPDVCTDFWSSAYAAIDD
ncbi:MAG: hypothetical protein JWO31_4230 [Phycisphaerales bacterium]|nr:hypothetical protein [Phycisphaerales bacterium]